MLHIHYQDITFWLHAHPHWGILAAFLVSFSESIAIIGTIIPGSVTMTAIGALAGVGVLPLWIIILSSILGAIMGDGLSYFFGYFYRESIPFCWPFSKYPAVLFKGREFIQKHGGKSIFIGRFIGPVRAIVPVIAGILHLPPRRYLPISIISAVLWAPFYMLPGILLGAVSLEMPPHIAAELIIFVISVSLCFWLIFRLTKYIYEKSHDFFARLLDQHWERWQQRPSTHWICVLLRNGSHPKQHGQLLLATLGIILIILLIVVLHEIFSQGYLLHLNPIIYHVFRGIRTKTLDIVGIFLTSFGQADIVIPLIVFLAAWFIYKRDWLSFIHWGAVSLFSISTVLILKQVYFFPRPAGIFQPPPFSSFPSGHTAFSVAIYGFLAFLIAKNLSKDVQKFIYWITGVFIIAISLSRLYLCVHWLTDVLCSVFIGLIILSAAVISYRRFPVNKITSTFSIVLIALLTLSLNDVLYLYGHLHRDLSNFKPYWKTYHVPEQAWWEHQSPLIPLYRMNRFGIPEEVLNIEWAGYFYEISSALLSSGWTNLKVSPHTAIALSSGVKKEIVKNKTLLPQLFNDQKPALELMLMRKKPHPPLILRIWPAHITLLPNHIPLWVGTIREEKKNHLPLLSRRSQDTHFSDPTRWITQKLNPKQWDVRQINEEKLPNRLIKRQSVYSIALIKPHPFTN